MITELNPATLLRIRRALTRSWDRKEAAYRLSRLLDASGNPNPVHQAKYFRASWEAARLMAKLNGKEHVRERGRMIVKVIMIMGKLNHE